jgi:branched-chain amino acid transport system permease protein
VLQLSIRRTRTGRAMRAVGEDRETAALMGIDVDRTIATTFAIGGLLAGAAGILFVFLFNQVRFFMGTIPGIKAFTAAVLGGIGNLTGAVLGGLLLGFIQAYNEGFLDARWTTTIVFSILILILVFRPSGLLGEQTPEGQ